MKTKILKLLSIISFTILITNLNGYSAEKHSPYNNSSGFSKPKSDTENSSSKILTEKNPDSTCEKDAPGKLSSFWWSFILSFIGGATLWGLGVGPISVLIVYFSSKRDKKEVRKSVLGWILGSLLGIAVWILLKTI